MAPKRRPGLPFRIPFFRIFYSTTYTILFLICLVLLAVTPATLIWTSIQNTAYQYILMIGGVYILTMIIALFIYASRLYTNRTVLAGVGKAYLPIEDGEIGKNIRKMIVGQLERSAVIAWETKPRDVQRELRQWNSRDSSEPITQSDVVGTLISVDPENTPWGHVQHPGWSSPSKSDTNSHPHVQFTNVVEELHNLVEARAVSLAPVDPETENQEMPSADPAVVDLLRRPETMGLRDYLTQLSYLGVFGTSKALHQFLQKYEAARFSGKPVSEKAFGDLMASFTELLAAMTELDPVIVEQIRIKADAQMSELGSTMYYHTPDHRPHSMASSNHSPVTARTRFSRATTRATTPYLQHETSSEESVASVIHRSSARDVTPVTGHSPSPGPQTPSLLSFPSDAGSVIRRRASLDSG